MVLVMMLTFASARSQLADIFLTEKQGANKKALHFRNIAQLEFTSVAVCKSQLLSFHGLAKFWRLQSLHKHPSSSRVYTVIRSDE